jgi:Beta-1,3-glucanase
MGKTLTIELVNETSDVLYAYITGKEIEKDALCVMQKQGTKCVPYNPPNPSGPGQSLEASCAIQLASGQKETVPIPQMAGGRVWFSIGGKLEFKVNPGARDPALVEPSVSNPSDPSRNVKWGFCEMTFDANQLYANISYVDFVGIPIGLHLTTDSGDEQHVNGLESGALETIVKKLREQADKDEQWVNLIQCDADGKSIRVVSPYQAMIAKPGLFSNYFDQYVTAVYEKYRDQTLSIETHTKYGVVNGKVEGDVFHFRGGEGFNNCSFAKPNTKDILSCDSGPFRTMADSPVRNAIIPRLSAAFNRATLLKDRGDPHEPAPASAYFGEGWGPGEYEEIRDVMNHYCRIVHMPEVNPDGLGYAFPYDDVPPRDGRDISGKVQAPDPRVFTITVKDPFTSSENKGPLGSKSASAARPYEGRQRQPNLNGENRELRGDEYSKGVEEGRGEEGVEEGVEEEEVEEDAVEEDAEEEDAEEEAVEEEEVEEDAVEEDAVEEDAEEEAVEEEEVEEDAVEEDAEEEAVEEEEVEEDAVEEDAEEEAVEEEEVEEEVVEEEEVEEEVVEEEAVEEEAVEEDAEEEVVEEDAEEEETVEE